MKKETKETYNGWSNRETYNVALWLQNDWPLYNVTKSYYGHKEPYKALRIGLRDSFNIHKTALIYSPGNITTPDWRVSLWDDALDTQELDTMIWEMQTE
jgi:hypothetical protein